LCKPDPAVTIDIGGNDRGECAASWASCPFRSNFFATVSDLRATLDSDPVAENFVASPLEMGSD
jgi:hypothetical protein